MKDSSYVTHANVLRDHDAQFDAFGVELCLIRVLHDGIASRDMFSCAR